MTTSIDYDILYVVSQTIDTESEEMARKYQKNARVEIHSREEGDMFFIAISGKYPVKMEEGDSWGDILCLLDGKGKEYRFRTVKIVQEGNGEFPYIAEGKVEVVNAMGYL